MRMVPDGKNSITNKGRLLPIGSKASGSLIPSVDSVVVIGASLMNAMFGESLSIPNSIATTQMAGLGYNIPVYGWATPGDGASAAVSHYNAARSAHPSALIISHYGGNDVTFNRPYPGNIAFMNQTLANITAATGQDPRFIPASITFRNYDGVTFQDPSLGSKPYNENLMIPWISQNYPNAMAPYGRPKLDFYRVVLQNFESWLHPDNIHLSSAGYAAFRTWILSRVADILSNNTIPEIAERTYTPPLPGSGNLAIVNYKTTTQPTVGQNSIIDMSPSALRSIPDIRDVDGINTGISLSHAWTPGATAVATDPGGGSGDTGRTSSVPPYSNQLLASEITAGFVFVTTSVWMDASLSGVVPGAAYELGFVGSRNATGPRNSVISVQGQTTQWDATEATPLERRLTVTAPSSGPLIIRLSTTSGSSFGYLGGFSIRRL